MSHRQKGNAALGNTCAASLEQSGARMIWALASLTCFQVHGTDTTNDFSEAPPHIAPLHVTIEKQYRNWKNNHLKLQHMLEGSVLNLLQASQCHSESPRL